MGALFTSFIAPVEIAFPDINEDFHKNTYMHSLDRIVDVIFLIDIFIGFITEYTDVSTGDQIQNPAKIAKRYVMGIFIFDVLSSCPFIFSILLSSLVEKN